MEIDFRIEPARCAAVEAGLRDAAFMVDNHWNANRLVLFDAYRLATRHEITGCRCCYYPDYVLHFTTELGGQKVYLRHKHWAQSPAHHALAWDLTPDIEMSRRRLPHLLRFYAKQGVPSSVIEEARRRIVELIDSEERSMEIPEGGSVIELSPFPTTERQSPS